MKRLVDNGVGTLVVLLPLMAVAGYKEDARKTQMKKSGYEVKAVLKGFGEYEDIQDMYVEYVQVY